MAKRNKDDKDKARRGMAFGGSALRPTERRHLGRGGQQRDFGKSMLPGRDSPSSNPHETVVDPTPGKPAADWVETEYLDESAPKGDGGFIYVMTNPDFPGSYKIGRTKMSVERRRNKLDTAVRKPFGVVMVLRVNNAKQAEKDLHKSLERKGYRENKRREYFNPPQERLEEMLSKFARMKWPEEKLRLWNPPK